MAEEYWQDKYISTDPSGNGYICWDEVGEFLCLKDSRKEARDALTEHADYLNGKHKK